MNRKDYLRQLLESRKKELGEVYDKFMREIDSYSEAKTEHVINAFMRYEERQKRIENGEAKDVQKELQAKRGKEKGIKSVARQKQLKKEERVFRKKETAELENILEELEKVA